VAIRASTLFSNCCSIIRIPTTDKTLFSRLAAEKWVPHSHETFMTLYRNFLPTQFHSNDHNLLPKNITPKKNIYFLFLACKNGCGVRPCPCPTQQPPLGRPYKTITC